MKITTEDVTHMYQNVAHMDSGTYILLTSDVMFTQTHLNSIFNIDGVDFVWGIGATFSKYKLLARINSNGKFNKTDVLINIMNTLRPTELEPEPESESLDSILPNLNTTDIISLIEPPNSDSLV